MQLTFQKAKTEHRSGSSSCCILKTRQPISHHLRIHVEIITRKTPPPSQRTRCPLCPSGHQESETWKSHPQEQMVKLKERRDNRGAPPAKLFLAHAKNIWLKRGLKGHSKRENKCSEDGDGTVGRAPMKEGTTLPLAAAASAGGPRHTVPACVCVCVEGVGGRSHCGSS